MRIPTGVLNLGWVIKLFQQIESNNQIDSYKYARYFVIPGSGFSINISTGTLLTLGAVNAYIGSSSGILSIYG
jgi:hypothetical protein